MVSRALRGQSATEYIMVLAAVLVIGIIVATLLSYFSGFSGSITERESQTYWQSVARPIRLLEVNHDAAGMQCTSSPISTVDVLRVYVQNTQTNPIVLQQIIVDNDASAVPNVCPGSADNSAPSLTTSNVTLGPGKSVLVGFISTKKKCTSSSQRVSMLLKFKYYSRSLEKYQIGEKDLIFTCA